MSSISVCSSYAASHCIFPITFWWCHGQDFRSREGRKTAQSKSHACISCIFLVMVYKFHFLTTEGSLERTKLFPDIHSSIHKYNRPGDVSCMHNAASTILVTENRLTIYSAGQREERRISSLLVGDECKQQVGGVTMNLVSPLLMTALIRWIPLCMCRNS